METDRVLEKLAEMQANIAGMRGEFGQRLTSLEGQLVRLEGKLETQFTQRSDFNTHVAAFKEHIKSSDEFHEKTITKRDIWALGWIWPTLSALLVGLILFLLNLWLRK